MSEADELLNEYVEQKQYVEDEKPYWLSLRHPRREEMQWDLFNYFPEAHYEMAVDQALMDQVLEPDGGTTNNLHRDDRRSKVYYWLNPETGAALYHTEAHGEEANPFFGSANEAEQFLEKHAENDSERYKGMSLYQARTKKVEDAVEVLLDQSGINDFG